jgi:hypothetical protein
MVNAERVLANHTVALRFDLKEIGRLSPICNEDDR